MAPGSFRFDRFHLDPADRRLTRDGVPVELNARYLDALALLVREQGRLVTKDRFLEEVWRGVPVTDEALTQCIRTLRRRLGDDAARPRFIETAPKHGYRFIAPVEQAGEDVARPAAASPEPVAAAPARRPYLLFAVAGMAGGAGAGLIGGLIYGFAAAAQPAGPQTGALSILLVLMCLTMAVGLVGGAGVGLGLAVGAPSGRPGPWSIAGGAVGGLVVGAIVKLLGLDAFSLLFGQTPGDFTGAPEGAALGAAVGLGAWLAAHGRARPPLRISVAAAGLAGAMAGLLIAIMGGRLMGGSLELLARSFPDSRLRLDAIGGLFGEQGFGPVSLTVTSALEGGLFAACVVGAVILARRGSGRRG